MGKRFNRSFTMGVCKWLIPTCEYAFYHLPLGKWKVNLQQYMTAHPLEWLKFKMLIIMCWQGYRATGTFIYCFKNARS